MITKSVRQTAVGRSCAVKTFIATISLINVVLVAARLGDINGWVYFGLLITCCVVFVLASSPLKINGAAYKLTATAAITILVAVVAFVTAKESGALAVLSDVGKLREFIAKSGAFGYAVLLFITVLEVVFLPIPAAVTIIIGAVLYGPLVSFAVSSIGMVLGSACCYHVGKRFGFGLVAWIAGKTNAEKYAKIISRKGKLPFFAMMLLPCFPDDLLCMLAGTAKLSAKFFYITILITRPISVAFYCFFGSDKLPNIINVPTLITILIALGLVFYVAEFIVKRRIERSENDENN